MELEDKFLLVQNIFAYFFSQYEFSMIFEIPVYARVQVGGIHAHKWL